MKQTILNNYSNFVKTVTSKPSNEITQMNERMNDLSVRRQDINLSLLITAGFGLSSETGEFNEIIKKCLFQGKELTDDNVYHMKRELGDILWYWCNAVRSLNLDPNDVIEENIQKLKGRYPGGEFDVYQSENRDINDI
jgi:NTP pyrophosphatase (non-canonical NTP hydrolase)